LTKVRISDDLVGTQGKSWEDPLQPELRVERFAQALVVAEPANMLGIVRVDRR
jgi:hypothetical protein